VVSEKGSCDKWDSEWRLKVDKHPMTGYYINRPTLLQLLNPLVWINQGKVIGGVLTETLKEKAAMFTAFSFIIIN
jgi:hypothetical protein